MIHSFSLLQQSICQFLSDLLKQTGKEAWVLSNHSEDGLLFSLAKKTGAIIIPSDSFNYYDVANKYNALILAPYDWVNLNIFRTYHKYRDKADFYPLADLYPLEMTQFSFHLGFNYQVKIDNPNIPLILELDISDLELDWLVKHEKKTKMITGETEPAKIPEFYYLTSRQKQMISKAYQREKSTRHKAISYISPKLRDIKDLLGD